MVTHHSDNKIAGRCVTPMDRVLGTVVEASPNENRRQSSQYIRKTSAVFGWVSPDAPSRLSRLAIKCPAKLVRTAGYAGIIQPEKGSNLASDWLNAC